MEALKDARSWTGAMDPEKVEVALKNLSPEEREKAMASYKDERSGLGTVLTTVAGVVANGVTGDGEANKRLLGVKEDKAVTSLVKGDDVGYRKAVIDRELEDNLHFKDKDKINRMIENADPKELKEPSSIPPRLPTAGEGKKPPSRALPPRRAPSPRPSRPIPPRPSSRPRRSSRRPAGRGPEER